MMPDNQIDYNATEAATILLKDYRERRHAFHVFDDYDSAMSNMRLNASARLHELSEPLKTVAARLLSINEKAFFLFQVCEWKLDYLAEALIHAIEANNPLALANNARALVEHLAALAAIVQELERLENTMLGQGEEKAINDALDKAERFIYRSFYGKSPKLTNNKNQQALHINDCLKALKKEVADIEDVYDFLCEYVHPNHGSNVLVSTGHLGTGRLNPSEDFHRETLDRLRRYCSLCMLFLREHGIQYGSIFIKLQHLFEKCFSTDAKISNVFSARGGQLRGDGKSQDTAYFFPKARTAMEAIKLTYEFLKKENYIVQRQEVGAIIDEFVYDVYVTSKGMIWFKMPKVAS